MFAHSRQALPAVSTNLTQASSCAASQRHMCVCNPHAADYMLCTRQCTATHPPMQSPGTSLACHMCVYEPAFCSIIEVHVPPTCCGLRAMGKNDQQPGTLQCHLLDLPHLSHVLVQARHMQHCRGACATYMLLTVYRAQDAHTTNSQAPSSAIPWDLPHLCQNAHADDQKPLFLPVPDDVGRQRLHAL